MKTWHLAVAVAVLAILGIVFVWQDGSSVAGDADEPRAKSLRIKTARDARDRKRQRVAERRIRRAEERVADKGESAKPRPKPVIDIEAEEERKLTAQQRKLLEDIRAALDGDHKGRMIKLIQKMQMSDEWPDGIPVVLKKAAIDGMAWFGADCLPELLGFFADSNPEVVEEVTQQYEDTLSDPDLAPEDISNILIAASRVIRDADTLDSLFTSFNELPHELGVATIKDIMENGTEQAKTVLPDNIDFYTGEDNIRTPDQLDEWLAENPDDPDDGPEIR